MFCVTDMLLKCHGSLSCPDVLGYRCPDVLFYRSPDVVCYRCVTEVPWLPARSHWHCHVLCYRCVTEVPWLPARSHWHCHVLMFCVTDVLLKCHGSLPGHTDIVMSCAFSPSGDILASGYVWFCLYEILVMSFFFSAFKTYCKISLIKYICIALSSMWIFSIGRNSIFFLFFFKSHIIMTVHVSLPESQCRKICCKC